MGLLPHKAVPQRLESVMHEACPVDQAKTMASPQVMKLIKLEGAGPPRLIRVQQQSMPRVIASLRGQCVVGIWLARCMWLLGFVSTGSGRTGHPRMCFR
jgi:hypothetical protein